LALSRSPPDAKRQVARRRELNLERDRGMVRKLENSDFIDQMHNKYYRAFAATVERKAE
jgi:hypothetical protein